MGAFQFHLVAKYTFKNSLSSLSFLNKFDFLSSGTLCDAVGIAHNIQYEAKTTITDRMEAVKGIQMILPLMCSVENAMSKYSLV